jgi:hypothetical protein
MDKDLQAIRDAWKARSAAGVRSSNPKGVDLSDDDAVRKQADKYVSAHAKEFAGWDNLPLDVLVKSVENYRETGQEAEQWKVEAWLLHHFAPQNIGGTYEAQVRVP